MPVRFGGYSRENNAYPTAWSPDSVRPSNLTLNINLEIIN